MKVRLTDLLKWPNPDKILAEIIAKVKRQQPRILTFAEHSGVPFHNNYAEYLMRIGGNQEENIRRRRIGSRSRSICDIAFPM